MLVEISMIEQRLRAVREVLDTGASVTDVATRYGVDRRTVHRWLVRYANEGLSALAEHSSRPGKLSAPDAAGGRSADRLAKKSPPRLGSTHPASQAQSTAGRPAVSLIDLPLFGPSPADRAQATAPYQTGLPALGALKADGAVADGCHGRHPSNGWDGLVGSAGIDDHSRFCVLAHLVVRATAGPVCDALLKALNAHGVP
ncbi:MAG: helix-turn-helix domain-containing protein, partial [Actinobacteria bacterium]|nr:helix-turn-helix domain-containing protein [Actinomycetota bacterium]